MSEAIPAPSAPPTAAAADPLAQARREASIALLTMAVLLAGFPGVLIVVPRLLGAPVDVGQTLLAFGVLFGLAAAFATTGVWARYQTLPAAVVGLILYLVLAVLHLAVGLVLILLALLLVKSIRTCLKGRRAVG